MEKNNLSACCRSHKSEIMGVIFLAIATVLTLYTQSGLGILGMFIVGLVFCKPKHFGCSQCGCTNCECCGDMSACDMPVPKPKKVAVPRKNAKKV